MFVSAKSLAKDNGPSKSILGPAESYDDGRSRGLVVL